MRGPADDPVVGVANFSDWQTDNLASPDAEYIIPGWPGTPAGRTWIEITESRDVPPDRVGRESVSAWEAKVADSGVWVAMTAAAALAWVSGSRA